MLEEIILYSWYIYGYLKDDSSPFKNLNEVCFSNLTLNQNYQVDKPFESAFIIHVAGVQQNCAFNIFSLNIIFMTR